MPHHPRFASALVLRCTTKAVRVAIAMLVMMIAFSMSAPVKAGDRQQAALVIDASTGRVLYAENADVPVYPASLTKMMTLYLTFEAIKRGQLGLEQSVPVSAAAASMPPSKLGLKAGSKIVVRTAILALVTKSANDAAVVLAEAVGGSEANFARLMTQRARQLGMNSTSFRNASGLPNPDQKTTARDMVTLGQALMRDHPTFFPYFSKASMVYGRRVLRNHNHLMETYVGMDCCKTGYINASGFNLVASARRDGHRLMAAVFGGASAPSRDRRMAMLLDQSFASIGVGGTAKTQVADAKPAAEPTLKPTTVRIVASNNTGRRQLPPATIEALLNGIDDDAQGDRGRASDDVAEGVTPVGDWSIQVGAFATRSASNRAIAKARADVPNLAGAESELLPTKTRRGSIYRARLSGMDRPTAMAACERLKSSPAGCMVVAPE